MSEDNDNDNAVAVESSCCAACGIAECDDIKLEKCDDCDLVRYCSDECQKEHKSEHEEACKKRLAEIRDELLFKQPESTNLGDCPICMLPLPIDLPESVMTECCSKVVCNGCCHATKLRDQEMRLKERCPFCREAKPETQEELDNQRMKRIKANDPVSMLVEGAAQYEGKNYIKAVEYWTKAAELGNADAHCKLVVMYQNGQGVEKDKGKEMYHLEEAAIGGHPIARYLLGKEEINNRNAERAVKHFIIGSTQGCDFSIKMMMKAYRGGFVSKEVLAATLRAHQAAVDATKSPQREAAAQYYGC